MANITRKAVLSALVESPETINIVGDEGIEVLEKMLEQITKPASRADSKTKRENIVMARKVAETLNEGDVFKGDYVRTIIPTVLTTQKSTAILRTGVNEGIFTSHKLATKVGSYSKGDIVYALAGNEVWGD